MPTAKPRFARLDSDEEDVFVKKKDEDLENNSDNNSDSDSDSSADESKSVSVAVKNKQPLHLLNSQKLKPALKKAALQQPREVVPQPEIFVKNSTASSSSGGSSSSSGSSAGSSSSASSSSDEQSSSASSPGEQSHSVGEEGNDVLPEDEGCSSTSDMLCKSIVAKVIAILHDRAASEISPLNLRNENL